MQNGTKGNEVMMSTPASDNYGEKVYGKYYRNQNGYFAEEQDIAADDYAVEDGIAVGTDLQTINKSTGEVKYWVAYEDKWYER